MAQIIRIRNMYPRINETRYTNNWIFIEIDSLNWERMYLGKDNNERLYVGIKSIKVKVKPSLV